MSGDVQVRFCERPGVRFPRATHLVVGFQHRREAERFLAELQARFKAFGLELHPDKTRLVEFGRFAGSDRRRRGEGKPETFDFLGFTHSCAKTQRGGFTVLRQTMRKRLRAKLKQVKTELRQRMHAPIPEQGAYVQAVVRGHGQYYGVPMNTFALSAFRREVGRIWWRVLKRRSDTNRLPWERMKRTLRRWVPNSRVCHPYPLVRLGVGHVGQMTRGRSPVR